VEPEADSAKEEEVNTVEKKPTAKKDVSKPGAKSSRRGSAAKAPK
jgi:hypothetical protein